MGALLMRHDVPVELSDWELAALSERVPDAVGYSKVLVKQSCCDPADHGLWRYTAHRPGLGADVHIESGEL